MTALNSGANMTRTHLACLLALIACPSWAGLPEGKEAFNQRQYAEARKELADPASQGQGEAMAIMGEMLMRGLGGERNELKARDYIVQAHDKGEVMATYALGRMYLTGNLVNKDEAKGIELIRDAAQKLHAPAQSLLGALIANGLNGFQKDDAIALSWFKVAAEQKDPLGMYWMGTFSERGTGGIAADYLQALDWYKKAGDLLNTEAMVSAGRMYALGRGVNPDGAEALRWLRRAAGMGNATSYLWIGNVYEFGRGGIARNSSLAYSWYSAVPATVSPNTGKAVSEGKERLQKVLSAAELTEAEKQSKTVVAQSLVTTLFAQANRQPANRKGVYGSGVVVSTAGDIVTNEHVIQGCTKVRALPQGQELRVVGKDSKNDLALLRLENGNLPAVRLRTGKGIRLGDDLVAVGYPLRGLLSAGPIVTSGIANALSGLGNDTSAFQMSATVQPGSSGGPIFDRYGLLVGIVRQRLLPTAPANPQNVNFGINLATVSGFLDAHSVDYAVAPAGKTESSVSEIVARVQPSTVQIECF